MAKLTKILASALALAGSSAATWPPNSKDCTTTAAAADGFPTPNAQQLRDISERADGSLSNAPPPATLADSTLQSLQVIAFNEEFETAYFQSLLANVTMGVPGYESWKGYGKAELEKILKVIIAVSFARSCRSGLTQTITNVWSFSHSSKKSFTPSMHSTP